MKITITIETGNQAMQNGTDVIAAIGRKLQRISNAVDVGKVDSGKIMDVNGNSVGTWEVEK